MEIHLKQDEIEQALQSYITQQGFSLVGKKVVIDFTAGRKDNGLCADISITKLDVPQCIAPEEQKPIAAVLKETLHIVEPEPVAEVTVFINKAKPTASALSDQLKTLSSDSFEEVPDNPAARKSLFN